MQQLISLTRFKSFKSEPQRYACELAILTKQNLIVVLPTGGGKSLVFSFYALKMQSRFLTLIIVSTNALCQELEYEPWFGKCRWMKVSRWMEN